MREENEENKPRCAHHGKDTGYGTPIDFVSHGFTAEILAPISQVHLEDKVSNSWFNGVFVVF